MDQRTGREKAGGSMNTGKLAALLMNRREAGESIAELIKTLLAFRSENKAGPLFVTDELISDLITAEQIIAADIDASQSPELAGRAIEALWVLLTATGPGAEIPVSTVEPVPDLDRFKTLIPVAYGFIQAELGAVNVSPVQ